MAKKKAAASKDGVPVVPEVAAEYLVVKRIVHDGDTYLPSETIELTSAQAASLLQLRVIEPILVVVKEAE